MELQQTGVSAAAAAAANNSHIQLKRLQQPELQFDPLEYLGGAPCEAGC